MTRFIRITVSFFLLLVLGVGVATAQTVWHPITVTGQVVDAVDGQPIVAVHMCFRNDATGEYMLRDLSDYDGHFELSYPRKYMMTVTRIGYLPQQLHFSSDTTILIRLERDPTVTKCPEIILVSGVVLNKEYDEPLIGATVRIKGTDTSVTTDINGEFEIEALKGMVLEVIYVGYHQKEIKIKNKEPIIIKLQDTGAMLQ
jgi:hypothetical protein